MQPPGSLSQIQLAAHKVNGIYDVIIVAALREEECPVIGIVQRLHGVQDRLRIDFSDAPGYGLGLWQSNGRGQGL